MRAGGKSAGQVAKDLDLAGSALRDRVKQVHPDMSLIFAHRVGSLKELWDVPCPSPTGEPFGPRGGVVPTRSAREALRALLLDVVSIQ